MKLTPAGYVYGISTRLKAPQLAMAGRPPPGLPGAMAGDGWLASLSVVYDEAAAPRKPVNTVRTYFPETFLWELFATALVIFHVNELTN